MKTIIHIAQDLKLLTKAEQIIYPTLFISGVIYAVILIIEQVF